mmetsp:Transcript_76664/g.171504  ORF Transcript_76664/g.171504 Transcript_76664/m.171504 type:complete len:257 (+) Transcript_76664:2-772(+)
MLPSGSPMAPRPMVRPCAIFSRVAGSKFEAINRSASRAGWPPMPLQTGPETEDTRTAGPTPQQPWHTMVWTSTFSSSNPTTPWLQSRTLVPSAAMAMEGMKAPLSAEPTWSGAEMPPAFTAEGKDSSKVLRMSSVGAKGSEMRRMDRTLFSSAFLLSSCTSPSKPPPKKKGVAPASRKRPTESTGSCSTSIGGQSCPLTPPAYSTARCPAAWPMPPPHAQPTRVRTPRRSRSFSSTGTKPCAMVTCNSPMKAKPAS